MSVSAGTRLGAYEILAPIGKGGMGEVWKARDTRLGREVAIKFSGEAFSDRFQREAHAIASLNHPNVCTLYDAGPDYLVMELIEGQTLAERIKQGVIPLDEALLMARQIADALDAAHEKGITHRDLKPGNIKIRPDSTVKVLDFGLAKVGGTPVVHTEESPTLTMGATQAGVILGTAAYMSPEQARGKPVDKRADIWAFGVVLYEMLTAKRLFEGETVSDILAAVITKEPDLRQVPVEGRNLIQSCLEKDPRRRLRDIGDMRRLVEEDTTARGKQHWAWIAAACVGPVVAAITLWAPWRTTPLPVPIPSVHYQISPPEKSRFTPFFSLSPDGRQLVFSAPGSDGQMHLWLRNLNSLESYLLPGTEHPGSPAANPFWSPDSRYIAFVQDGKLKKIAVSGGAPQTLCDTPDGDTGGGSWSQDGLILVGSASHGLFRVSASGGAPTPVTQLDAPRRERYHRRPVFLPDGQHFLYVRSSIAPENSGVFLRSVSDPPNESGKKLLDGQIGVAYVPSVDGSTGYIAFLCDGTLMAQVLDPGTLDLVGQPMPVAGDVGTNGTTTGMFSLSSGILAYQTGLTRGGSSLMWVDRRGDLLGEIGNSVSSYHLALSPDGARLAAGREVGGNRDLWLLEIARSAVTRFTFDAAADENPVWSPDGRQIAFESLRSGGSDLYTKASDGSEVENLVLTSSETKRPADWSPDGKVLLYQRGLPPKVDLWTLAMDDGHKTSPFLATPFDEVQGKFSPDGRWVAYASNETGRFEIYVRPFPADSGGSKSIISTNGGIRPRWRRDGKEIFYVTYDGKLMSVAVNPARPVRSEAPKLLFDTGTNVAGAGIYALTHWDAAPDGQRFALSRGSGGMGAGTAINVVTNWTNLLKR